MDFDKLAQKPWYTRHANNVITTGSTEPVFSLLDLRGFELRDLLLVGLNDSAGSLYLPTEERAKEAVAALEPAFATEVRRLRSMWDVAYTRRALDGTTLSPVITDLTLKDGTAVIRNGRHVN
ncbi:hypothetical protein [Streptomyces ramulosus]|uniref:hypothetical protein n=1 Tax=Streptomyces TaxID=1883 RepID=UPI0031EC1CB9